MSIYESGLGNVAAYQVSGRPFVSGGINVYAATLGGTPLKISFPSVTQWVVIKNMDNAGTAPVKFGVSAAGLAGDNYFTVMEDYSNWKSSTTPRLRLKVTNLYLTGSSTNVDVIAGLTGINTSSLPNNWSGVEGVG